MVPRRGHAEAQWQSVSGWRGGLGGKKKKKKEEIGYKSCGRGELPTSRA